ncbi:MAG TPA: EAL domain-containing protein [Pirellulaceae bacterium]|nr:EAL domain-containing protein [Pirellulaceae bacterium]
MRTNLLPSAATALFWLERDIPGKEPERIELEQLPFTLGRNESCDYQILSSRVSREHAEIVRDEGVLKVRDLKSTNGTFVNGQRIDEHRLTDGDLVVIADVHFSLRTNRSDGVRKTVTQVMDRGDSDRDSEEDAVGDLIHAVRRMHETLLHRATRNRFQPVYDLMENRCVGYEAISRPQLPGDASTAQQILENTDCRLTERTNQLHRLIAAEHIARLSSATLLFVNLQPAEVGADLLPQSLSRLAAAAGGKRIVAEIPDSAVVDIPYFRDFRLKLRDLGIGVAYDGFAGSPHQIKAQAEFAPDYLKLSPALGRGVDKSTQRQEQIKALVDATSQSNVQVIAVGVHSENEARTCREIGCRLAQGDHFGHAQTIDWPLEGFSQSA